MQIPTDTKLFEGELATFWFNEEGVLCAKAKRAVRTLEKQIKNYALIRQITNNKKVCLLSDTSTSDAQDRETRDYTAIELPNIFKAMAVISSSAAGRMVANIFLSVKGSPIPIKLFSNENEARKWLKQYL